MNTTTTLRFGKKKKLADEDLDEINDPQFIENLIVEQDEERVNYGHYNSLLTENGGLIGSYTDCVAVGNRKY